jgi:hypothetical protein
VSIYPTDELVFWTFRDRIRALAQSHHYHPDDEKLLADLHRALAWRYEQLKLRRKHELMPASYLLTRIKLFCETLENDPMSDVIARELETSQNEFDVCGKHG